MNQINFTVGDIAGNAQKMERAAREAASQGANLTVFSELSLTGYPPKDLLLDASFIASAKRALERLAKSSKETAMLVGWPEKNPDAAGKPLFNSASLLHKGKIVSTHRKMLLPFYDVFDETRYFEPGDSATVVSFNGTRLGITICEDIWNDKNWQEKRFYRHDPLALLMKKKPDMVVNLSASPYWAARIKDRRRMLSHLAKQYKKPFLYTNAVGGNDELIFDGGSLAFDSKGRLAGQAPMFKEGMALVEWNKETLKAPASCPASASLNGEAEIYEALVLGLRDYVRKCGFKSVVLGLSGGIDSSLVSALACDALGAKNVLGVIMPSRYSSDHSQSDAEALAKKLGMPFKRVPIEPVFEAYLKTFSQMFDQDASELTQQNIQARIRGALLMAFSNQEGHMTLSTGNKSELAMGYCTLYGDLSGGLAPISDLPKGLVYRLARWRNQTKSASIPENVFTKAPSAELKPNQTDQDTLPPYETLDKILELYIVEGKSAPEISKTAPAEIVNKVLRSVDANEFKRRQAPPGLKVTPKAFGIGRRMPIASKKTSV